MNNSDWFNLEYVIKKGKLSSVCSFVIGQESVLPLANLALKYDHQRIVEYLVNLHEIDYDKLFKYTIKLEEVYVKSFGCKILEKNYNFKLLKLFLKKSATAVFKEDVQDYMKIAANNGEHGIVEFLLNNCEVDDISQLYRIAIDTMNIWLVKILLKKRWKYSLFKELCSLSIIRNDFELVKFFIDKGDKYLDLTVFKKYAHAYKNIREYILLNTSIQKHKGINKQYKQFLEDRRTIVNPIISEFIGSDISSIIDEYLIIIYDKNDNTKYNWILQKNKDPCE